MGPSEASDSLSIFEGGKLKSGIYKIQNLQSGTFLDIHEHSREVCCRPIANLGQGKGLVRPYLSPTIHVSDCWKWEIMRFGTGYAVRRVSVQMPLDPVSSYIERNTQVDPGKPEQYCTLMDGLRDGTPLCVATYPVAWRVEIVEEKKHSGYEYVRSGQGFLEIRGSH